MDGRQEKRHSSEVAAARERRSKRTILKRTVILMLLCGVGLVYYWRVAYSLGAGMPGFAAATTLIICGGFSAGCDMLLRAICFTPARCDVLVLQSPWIPVLQEHSDALVRALREKHIALRIFCGLEDEDCLPLARQLYTAAKDAGLPVTLTTQEHTRHQFPEKPYTLEDILSPERQMCI